MTVPPGWRSARVTRTGWCAGKRPRRASTTRGCRGTTASRWASTRPCCAAFAGRHARAARCRSPSPTKAVSAGQLTVGNVVRGAFNSAYVGYWVDEAVAGRGVMPTALALVVDHCFGPARLHRIEANIRPENVASQTGCGEARLSRRGSASAVSRDRRRLPRPHRLRRHDRRRSGRHVAQVAPGVASSSLDRDTPCSVRLISPPCDLAFDAGSVKWRTLAAAEGR